MSLLVNILCFVLGVVSTVFVLLVWAWYLGMQEKVARAEAARQDMENLIKQFEEQSKAASAALQQSITELVKRRQAQLQAQQALPQVPTDPNVAASVKERLRKAVEITVKQQKIDVRKGPDFVMQHNELELEKLTVLRTILKDGFDPVITIRYSNGDQEMPLSSYLQTIEKGLA
jgi:Tfp pilus assembly protein PilN